MYSVWKEYDHGTVVRQRVVGGGFLETDVRRGQWNRYAGNGGLVARRTDSGLVFESDMLGRMRLTGNAYDFRGPVTELRLWGRRIREAQRMPWSGTVLPVSPDGPGAGAGAAGEARGAAEADGDDVPEESLEDLACVSRGTRCGR
ncbi:hypothetical protein ACFV2H_37405 [Streptomyces sp. NPDC059629]|uniref:hypothetical protein n=1 Tax=Streptomyces sp. NPDC059629 TaxID=3346889 RepID=UPI0036CBDC80